jgi:mannosyltransferase OCH1-like enzyme
VPVAKLKDIPKVFHFIWVGGDVPEEHVDNIAAWKQAHPAYKAILWYDAANMLANTIRKKVKKAGQGRQPFGAIKTSPLYQTHDKGRFDVLAARSHTAGKEYKDEDYYVTKAGAKLNLLLMKLQARQVEGCDIRAKYAKSFKNMTVYDLEMANESPNMGAASDVLRLEILIKEGGIYMDVDIGFKKTLPNPLQVREDLALFGIYSDGRVCNALIAACPGSELLKTCRASIKESYKRLDTDTAFAQAYDKDMRSFTVQNTGPTVVSKAARGAETKAATKGKLGAVESMQWAQDNVYFPDGYVDWDTPAAKVHKWL